MFILKTITIMAAVCFCDWNEIITDLQYKKFIIKL